MTAQRTAGPLATPYRLTKMGRRNVIVNSAGACITYVDSDVPAIERILIRVNAHDELVAALKAAEARLDQPVLHTNTAEAGQILRADIRSALAVIRAALAKAQS